MDSLENIKLISLTQGLFAIVDAEDYDNLNQYKWNARRNGSIFYACRNSPKIKGIQKTIAMHRVIMNTPKDMHTDHINGNGLDNRKENLRICTGSQNSMNKKVSGGKKYKGVTFHKASKKWQVYIMANHRNKYLGIYSTEVEAAKAYNEAATRLFGVFARLNEIK